MPLQQVRCTKPVVSNFCPRIAFHKRLSNEVDRVEILPWKTAVGAFPSVEEPPLDEKQRCEAHEESADPTSQLLDFDLLDHRARNTGWGAMVPMIRVQVCYVGPDKVLNRTFECLEVQHPPALGLDNVVEECKVDAERDQNFQCQEVAELGQQRRLHGAHEQVEEHPVSASKSSRLLPDDHS